MSVDAVPASASRGSVGSWWLRLIVRTTLALLALWVLAFADDRYEAYLRRFRPNEFRTDAWLWLSWMGAVVGGGLLFGLAIWLPFTRVRFVWSGLLLAAIAFVPIAQYWWVWIFQLQRHRGLSDWLIRADDWLFRADWFFAPPAQTALAALTGVAIASVFRAKNSEAVGADR